MRVQRLTNGKIICKIGEAVIIKSYRHGKKYVSIIRTPMFTQIITYKTEKEQYLDTFKRIQIMTSKKCSNYELNVEEMWKYYKYYTEE